MIYQAELLAFP